MAKNDEDKGYYTKSAHEVYLEQVSDKSFESDSRLEANSYTLNPNPFGDEAYAGTDPIYQNYADDTHKPLKASKGAFKAAEDQARALHKGEADAEDTGLGGKAAKAGQAGVQSDRYLVPGQEGYKEPQTGLPVRAADVKDDEDDEKDKGVTETNNPGTNMGASVAPPPAPDSGEQKPGVGTSVKK